MGLSSPASGLHRGYADRHKTVPDGRQLARCENRLRLCHFGSVAATADGGFRPHPLRRDDVFRPANGALVYHRGR